MISWGGWGWRWLDPNPFPSWWTGDAAGFYATFPDWDPEQLLAPGTDRVNNDKKLVKAYNVDNENWNFKNAFRYRHKQDTSLNALYADGHVEAREIGTVLRRDVSVCFK